MVAVNNPENDKMNKIKNLGFIISILIIILVLIVIRTSNKNLFKQDPQYAIDTATKSINTISKADLKKLSPQYIVVNLDKAEIYNPAQFEQSINIPFERILEENNRKILDKAKGEIVLFSEDNSTASKAWVILNQLNITNVLILQTEANQDVFKYKFQSDTTAKLE